MQDKIFSICEALSKSGIKPTAEKVRDELGGGSFSTISPIIKQWRENQCKAEPLPEIPPEAQNAVNHATAIIWKIANEHHVEAINAVKLECSRIEQEAIAERDEALNEIRFLESQIKELNARIESLETQSKAMVLEKNDLELEARKQQLAMDSMSLANSELKTELKGVVKERSSLELQVHKQQLILDTMTNDLALVKGENKELRKVASVAQGEASKLEGMLEVFKSSVPKTRKSKNSATETKS